MVHVAKMVGLIGAALQVTVFAAGLLSAACADAFNSSVNGSKEVAASSVDGGQPIASSPSLRGSPLLTLETQSEILRLSADADRCQSSEQPLDSKCKGCPPVYNGKLCATTTWYEDQTKGSCGCGETPMVPDGYWTLTSFTAALNTVSMDPQDPALTYCLSGCGSCYEICTTGGVINSQDTITSQSQCEVFKITNRCADGWQNGTPDWCSHHMSWQECQANPQKCRKMGNTNMYGYSAHFDLQDADRQVQHTLGWMNPEVTFEPVSCDKWKGPPSATCPGCDWKR